MVTVEKYAQSISQTKGAYKTTNILTYILNYSENRKITQEIKKW